MSEVILAILDP